MAGDRDPSQQTEEPTARRLQKAQEQGDQVKSAEVQTLILLLGGVMTIAFLGPGATRDLAQFLSTFLAKPAQIAVDGGALTELLRTIVIHVGTALAPVFGMLVVSALASNFVQNRPQLNPERVKFNLNKLSPMTGLKRIFGVDGISTLLKGLVKIVVVGGAIWTQVWPERAGLEAVFEQSPAAVVGDMTYLMFRMMSAALVAIAVIALADYLLQRHEFYKRNRMSKQEVKEEFKEAEGDPLIKNKLRRLRMEKAQKRMMAAVPEATVVITNPTHFAVALRYVAGETAAPICVAKGVDALAFRIRAVAEENKVPVVENPPLARALYATVEVDQMIPAEHYQAVAQVIGYVLRLAGKLRPN